MFNEIDANKITRYIVVSIIILAIAILINKRMSYMDVYYNEVTEPGYVYSAEVSEDGLRLIANGLNLNYLYSGKYIITISHSPAQSGDYCEVVDNKTGEVLGTKEYSTNDNVTAVLVNIKERAESVTVKSYCREKIAISGYIIKSDGKVFTDTHWLRRLLFLYGIAIVYGYWSLKKRGGRFLQLLLFATICSMPLWTQMIPSGHDVAFNYTRYRGIVEGLRLHEFPVRINGAFYHGAGYLVDLMYPGLIQYPFAFMSAHGASTLFSFKVMLIVSVFATVFCAYYPLRGILGDKTALIFMFIYTLNPFRLKELYIRCALGEYLAMIFLPLVFAGIYQLVLGDYKRGFYEAFLGITLVFFSHLLSILFVVGFSVLSYVLLIAFTKFEVLKDLKRDVIIILCAICTVVVNVWFWLPMLDYYNPNYCIASFHGNISNSLIYIFGAFMDGYTPPQLEKQIGTAANVSAIFSVGIVLLICVCIYLYKRFVLNEAIANKTILDFSLLLGIIALFVESEWFPWKYMEENGSAVAAAFGKFQFAWRFQMVVAVTLGIVAAGIMNHMLNNRRELFWSLFIILVINATWLTRGYLFENDTYQIDKYTAQESTLNGDYLESDIDYTSVGKYLQNGGGPLSTDDLVINNARRDGINYSVDVINYSKKDAGLVLPMIYSGFYKAYVNGEEVQTYKDAQTTLTKIIVDGTTENALVQIVYNEPWKYRISELVSLITFMVLTISAMFMKIKNVMSRV